MKRILTILLVAFAALTVVSCKKTPTTGKLVGDVCYRDHQTPGVDVTLTGTTGTFTFTTITDGYFYFEQIPAGDYIVSCSYNGKLVASYLKNYEKSENPRRITILPGELHSRNVIIPDTEDLDLDIDDDNDEGDEEEDEEE